MRSKLSVKFPPPHPTHTPRKNPPNLPTRIKTARINLLSPPKSPNTLPFKEIQGILKVNPRITDFTAGITTGGITGNNHVRRNDFIAIYTASPVEGSCHLPRSHKGRNVRKQRPHTRDFSSTQNTKIFLGNRPALVAICILTYSTPRPLVARAKYPRPFSRYTHPEKPLIGPPSSSPSPALQHCYTSLTHDCNAISVCNSLSLYLSLLLLLLLLSHLSASHLGLSFFLALSPSPLFPSPTLSPPPFLSPSLSEPSSTLLLFSSALHLFPSTSPFLCFIPPSPALFSPLSLLSASPYPFFPSSLLFALPPLPFFLHLLHLVLPLLSPPPHRHTSARLSTLSFGRGIDSNDKRWRDDIKLLRRYHSNSPFSLLPSSLPSLSPPPPPALPSPPPPSHPLPFLPSSSLLPFFPFSLPHDRLPLIPLPPTLTLILILSNVFITLSCASLPMPIIIILPSLTLLPSPFSTLLSPPPPSLPTSPPPLLCLLPLSPPPPSLLLLLHPPSSSLPLFPSSALPAYEDSIKWP
ncbi:hypothetical protein C7M84_021647 [Penaeus vannamei]|uniref:Uncharacterized protein n=1 Tax=Penaeus vannamei TaxID=6689 RepID=A0A423S9C8_PENVA|nr:hypothetical protein C7M84_021647 [Penaeus vannamei]